MTMPMSITIINMHFFTCGNDTGDKFNAGVLDTGHKLMPGVNATGNKTLNSNICRHFQQNLKWLQPSNQALRGH